MKIGILSDTHNQTATTAKALKLLSEQGAERILHCGDIEDPHIVDLFAGVETHFVFGNCDLRRGELRQAIARAGATLHEPFGELSLAGRSLAWIHGDDHGLFLQLQLSDRYDFLFHGHTHEARDLQVGHTRIINPGALHRAKPKTCVVLDLSTGQSTSLNVEP